MEFIEYSKCSTCKKAKKYLEENNIEFIGREIKENTPTIKEINDWINKFDININNLFNTSGMIYREMKLKDKLDSMSTDKKIELLSNNAMLIKRPLLICDDIILIGFREKEYSSLK